ncbi:MAG: shikimate dehydrogenase [Candidatus Omnitrophica bacterium]|nr:shikimate dehydrogenase [Candidatus Omnitrophota bacterium]
MVRINGETKLIGFLGSTYRTSKMYVLYNAAIDVLGLNYVYVPFVVRDLAKAVDGIRHLGIAAAGVTIPYKLSIIPFLDELDDDAKQVGAVAAVVNRDGKLIGGTTDGKGALKALQEKTGVSGKNITLIGAGGAARAIGFSLQQAGGKLTILNRIEEIDMAESLAKALGCPWGDLSGLESSVSQADIVIQTTPVGMANTPLAGKSIVPPELLNKRQTVMDIVTNPRKTPLLQEAENRGCQVVYGERMLLWQGVYKFKLFTGVEPPVEAMERAMERTRH